MSNNEWYEDNDKKYSFYTRIRETAIKTWAFIHTFYDYWLIGTSRSLNS